MYFVQSSEWNGNTSENGDDKDYINLGFQIDSRESLPYQTRNDCFWKCHLKFLIDIYDIMNQDLEKYKSVTTLSIRTTATHW